MGYDYVTLSVPGEKQIKHYVHRLVAQAYLGDSGLTVNHINEDKLDNRVENLEWVTQKENVNKWGDNNIKKLSTKNATKLTEKDVRRIKQLLVFSVDPKVIASLFKINKTSVYDIKNKRTWGWV